VEFGGERDMLRFEEFLGASRWGEHDDDDDDDDDEKNDNEDMHMSFEAGVQEEDDAACDY
jgi:hypothetical protein